jgi:hypothetical protein
MAIVAAGVSVGVARANPDVVMPEIEVKVKREVGLAYTRRSHPPTCCRTSRRDLGSSSRMHGGFDSIETEKL